MRVWSLVGVAMCAVLLDGGVIAETHLRTTNDLDPIRWAEHVVRRGDDDVDADRRLNYGQTKSKVQIRKDKQIARKKAKAARQAKAKKAKAAKQAKAMEAKAAKAKKAKAAKQAKALEAKKKKLRRVKTKKPTRNEMKHIKPATSKTAKKAANRERAVGVVARSNTAGLTTTAAPTTAPKSPASLAATSLVVAACAIVAMLV